MRGREGSFRAGATFGLFAVGGGLAAILSHLDTVAHGFRVPGADLEQLYDRPFAVMTHLAGLFLGKIHVSPNPLVRSELTVFVGLLGTALALAGAVRCFRDPSARFLSLFGAAALVAAFTRPVVELLLRVPVANLSMPSRWVFVANLCIAALAAWGYDALAKETGRIPHLTAATACFFAGLAVIGAGPFRFSSGAFQETLAGFALAVAAACAIPRSAAAGAVLGAAAILVDLLPGFLVVNAHADPAPLKEVPEAVRFAKAREQEPWRAVGGLRDPSAGPAAANGWTVTIGYNLLALHGVEAAAGYEAAPPANLVAFCAAAGGSVMGSGRVVALGNLDSRLLDAAGVKYVFMPYDFEPGGRYRKAGEWGRMKLYENPSALPRAFLARGILPARDGEEALALLRRPDFDPASAVILEGAGEAKGTGGRVRWLERAPDRLRLEVEAEGDGVLVLSETGHPGWRARVDGRPAAIRRANVAFRAVKVPAGKHVVEFRFRPWWVMPGLAGSGFSLLLAALLLGVRKVA